MATKSANKRGPKTMTNAHKAALAKGREESRAISEYLDALEQSRPRRGRKRTPDSIRKRLARLAVEIDDASPARRVSLIQERMDLEDELETLEVGVDTMALEKKFVKYAKGYSERKGISYAAWREVGVAPAVLRAAGIGRGAA